MMKTHACAAIAASLLLPASAAHAQGIDVTGTWSIQMMADVGPLGAPFQVLCNFQGTAIVIQNGSRFSGFISVDLTSGDTGCPSSMSANLTGDVTGNQVSMGVAMGGGAFGTARFTGIGTAAAARGAGTIMNGSFTITSGPFSFGRGTGTWSATQLAPTEVPALGAKGLAALALLLLATALWLLSRRSALRGR